VAQSPIYKRIRRAVQSQSRPDFASTAKGLLVGSMDATTIGYVRFMSHNFTYQPDLNRGADLMNNFSQEVLYLSGEARPSHRRRHSLRLPLFPLRRLQKASVSSTHHRKIQS